MAKSAVAQNRAANAANFRKQAIAHKIANKKEYQPIRRDEQLTEPVHEGEGYASMIPLLVGWTLGSLIGFALVVMFYRPVVNFLMEVF